MEKKGRRRMLGDAGQDGARHSAGGDFSRKGMGRCLFQTSYWHLLTCLHCSSSPGFSHFVSPFLLGYQYRQAQCLFPVPQEFYLFHYSTWSALHLRGWEQNVQKTQRTDLMKEGRTLIPFSPHLQLELRMGLFCGLHIPQEIKGGSQTRYIYPGK